MFNAADQIHFSLTTDGRDNDFQLRAPCPVRQSCVQYDLRPKTRTNCVTRRDCLPTEAAYRTLKYSR